MKKKQITPTNESVSSKRDFLYLRIDEQLLHVPCFHDSHELIYLLEGTATAIISGKTYTLKAGDICFVNPNQVHYYNAVRGEIRAIVMNAGKDYTHHFRSFFGKQTLPNVMRDQKKNQQILAVYEEWLALSDRSFLMNCSFANKLFDVLTKTYGVEECPIENEQLAFLFVQYIQENYPKPISLESAASHFSYSKEYFCSLFNKLVGQSFLTVLNLTRMEKAVELIGDPDNTDSIESISTQCGYNSMATFYRQYKAYLNNQTK